MLKPGRVEKVRRITRTLAVALVLVCVAGCGKLGRLRKSDKAHEGGVASATPATATPSATATATAAKPPPTVTAPPDGMTSAERATFETVKRSLADVQALVAKQTAKDAARSGEPDAKTKCESIDEARPRLASVASAEVKQVLETAQRVCGFDVPLLTAADALDQLRFPASQASRRLMCNIAEQEIAKARKVKASDRRVHTLDDRYRRTCHS